MTIRDVMGSTTTVDVLLRIADLPDTAEVEDLLRRLEAPVEVVLDCSGDREGKLCKYVEYLLKGYNSVRIVGGSVEKPRLNHEIPPPSISIGGRLQNRFRFHGLPEDLLAPSLLLAIATAGGAWPRKPTCPDSCRAGSVIVYVVPGVPCAKAMALMAQIVLCCEKTCVDFINVDTMDLLGLKSPVNRVPAFVIDRKRVVGVAGTVRDMARMLWG